MRSKVLIFWAVIVIQKSQFAVAYGMVVGVASIVQRLNIFRARVAAAPDRAVSRNQLLHNKLYNFVISYII